MTRRLPLLVAAIPALALGGSLLVGPAQAGAIVIGAPPTLVICLPAAPPLVPESITNIPLPSNPFYSTISIEVGVCTPGISPIP
jgi:hypothetical protein